MTLLEISLLILVIIAIILCVYLIISLKKINETLDFLSNDLKNVNEKLEPILDNLSTILEKALNISNETEKRVLDISHTIQNVRNTISRFTFRDSQSSGQKNPIQDLLSNLTAASKGFSAFWKKLNN
ncbi:MAG: DUF948 domain-containing protein [Ignavibacteriae bacterium]|nr:DUF948 domain-containing protein [Ignavibacteriota bacterium]